MRIWEIESVRKSYQTGDKKPDTQKQLSQFTQTILPEIFSDSKETTKSM